MADYAGILAGNLLCRGERSRESTAWMSEGLISRGKREKDIFGHIAESIISTDTQQNSEGTIMFMRLVKGRERNHSALLLTEVMMGKKELYYVGEMAATIVTVKQVVEIRGPRAWPLENTWKRAGMEGV